MSCFKRCANLWCFLVVFCLCYFLETITFTFLISAVQSIERHFQIPSSKSGTLIAASDIGYVSTVVFLAYLGSKGNRARWIGGGCVLISLACFLAAMPNFLFPTEKRVYSHDFIVDVLSPKMDENTTWDSLRSDPFLDLKYLEFDNKEREEIVSPNKSQILRISEITTTKPVELSIGRTEKTTLRMLRGQPWEAEQPGMAGLPMETTRRPFAHTTSLATTTTTKSTTRLSTTTLIPSTSPPRSRTLVEEVEVVEGSGDSKYTLEDLDDSEVGDDDAGDVDSHIRIVKREIESKIPLAVFENYKMLVEESLTENATSEWKALSILPFSFCNKTVRKLKKAIDAANCQEKQTNNAAYAIVFIAVACIGVGHSMPWTLGMPLIDDNVKKENTPLFFAGVFFIRIMGPVLGFVLGGWSNKLYVTLSPPRGLTPSDPGWIGAWWLGFLVISAALFVPSVLLCCFPNMDKKHNKSGNRADETDRNAASPQVRQHFADEKRYYDGNTLPVDEIDRTGEVKHKNAGTELKAFFVSLGECLKSPVYSGALVGRLFDAFAFKGFFVFQPKFLQNHFGIAADTVNYLMAGMGIIGFASGIVVGSFVMKKFKLEGRRAAAYVGVCSLISALLSFSEIFLGCNSVISQIGAMGQNNSFNYDLQCNNNCMCDKNNLFPVCDINHNPYFNPCYAGCRLPIEVSHKPIAFNYTECGCSGNGSVSRDYCIDDCTTPKRIYFGLSTISGIVSGSAVIPGILIVFRSVPHELRSVALGFSGFVVSLMSTFPSPIVLGSIIDTTCVLWEYTCGKPGSCQIYDPNAFRIRMHAFHGILRACSLLFDVWVWYWAKNLKLMEEKEEGGAENGGGNKLAVDEQEAKGLRFSMPELKKNRKKSAVVDFVETFGSQYELNIQGVGSDPPSDLGSKAMM